GFEGNAAKKIKGFAVCIPKDLLEASPPGATRQFRFDGTENDLHFTVALSPSSNLTLRYTEPNHYRQSVTGEITNAESGEVTFQTTASPLAMENGYGMTDGNFTGSVVQQDLAM